jgi:hypothetical protein
MAETLEEMARRLLASTAPRSTGPQTVPGVEVIRVPLHCCVVGQSALMVLERHGDVLKMVGSEVPQAAGYSGGAVASPAALGAFRFEDAKWPGCAHCGTKTAPAHNLGWFWWCTCARCNGMFHCAGTRDGQVRAACGQVFDPRTFVNAKTIEVRGWRNSAASQPRPSAPPTGGYIGPPPATPWRTLSSPPTYMPPPVPQVAAPRPAPSTWPLLPGKK